MIFEKRDEQKNCVRNFQIRKYAFLIFEKKWMSKKIAPGILRFVSTLFSYFKKRMSKKIAPEIFRFVSMLF